MPDRSAFTLVAPSNQRSMHIFFFPRRGSGQHGQALAPRGAGH
jgi:hypothetical protein